MVLANGDKSLDGCSVILHIGFPKTGTTSLQMALSTARPALLRRGVLYPRSAGDVSHRNLAAYAHGLDRNLVTHALLGIRSQDDLDRFRDRLRADLADEIGALPPDVRLILYSVEGLAGLSTHAEIEDLIDLVGAGGRAIRVICYVRRQDLCAVSQYTTLLKTGAVRKRILLDYPPDSTAFLFYDRKLQLWADVLGRDSITVRLFDRAAFHRNDLFEDFKQAAGIPGDVDLSVAGFANPSITPAACEFLRLFNAQFPRFADGVENPLRATVRETLERFFAGVGRLPARSDVEAFLRLFAAGNERIRATWFPDRDTLFDMDLSIYPDREHQPTIEQIMEVSNKVWEERLRGGSATP